MRDHYTSSWKWLEKLLLKKAESRSVNWQISLIFLFQQINHPEHNKHQSVQLTNEYKKYVEVDECLTQQMFHVFHHIFHFFMFEIWCWAQNIFFLIQIQNSELRFHFPDLQLHRKIVRMYKEYQLYQKNELRTYESNVVYIYIPYIWLPGKNSLKNYMLLIKVGRKICN